MKRNTTQGNRRKTGMTLEDSMRVTTSEAISKPQDRKDVLKTVEPWTQRPLFVTMEGHTRRISNDIEGLPRAVVVAIKRAKAMVISPARYSKEHGGNYVHQTFAMADGSEYSLTLTYPVCWVRAPGDRERALVWGLKTTGQHQLSHDTGDWLIIPRERSGQKAWVPKEDNPKDKRSRISREAFRAYPVSTEGLIQWLEMELATSESPFAGHQRCYNSWLLLTEQNHAIERWQRECPEGVQPFEFKHHTPQGEKKEETKT